MKKIFFVLLILFCKISQSQNLLYYKAESFDYWDKVNGNWANLQGVYSCSVSIKFDLESKYFEFKVYNGSDGYSVLTITFSLRESRMSQILSGKKISQKEFEQN